MRVLVIQVQQTPFVLRYVGSLEWVISGTGRSFQMIAEVAGRPDLLSAFQGAMTGMPPTLMVITAAPDRTAACWPARNVGVVLALIFVIIGVTGETMIHAVDRARPCAPTC